MRKNSNFFNKNGVEMINDYHKTYINEKRKNTTHNVSYISRQ